MILTLTLFPSLMQENNNIEALSYTGCSYDNSSRFCNIVCNMKKLRYLDWDGYPENPFPDSYHPMNLAVLRLSTSMQKDLWKSYKVIY